VLTASQVSFDTNLGIAGTTNVAGMELWAREIAEVTGGVLIGPDLAVRGAAIDSRELTDGQLFVPIIDERDGHDFVPAAVERGAAGYLSSRPVAGPDVDVAAVVVPDTAEALLALGRHARRRLGEVPGFAAVIGITGSVGKTTTKDLLRAAAGEWFPTTASLRSFNNELGVPLTLINAPERTQVSVVEMGARGAGHIAMLCELARPTVGVVTTVEMVHTEMFGDLADVAMAKGELIEALPSDGAAVLNADNPLVAAMAERTQARVLRFGAGPSGPGPSSSGPPGSGSNGADLWAGAVSLDEDLRPSFELHSPWGAAHVHLGVRGAHNVVNALAAAAAALVVGVPLDAVAEGLSRVEMSPWRMDLRTTPSGARVLNDAYNAGPASMAAALHALDALDASTPVAVLGVMAELGTGSEDAHRVIGDLAEDLGIELIAVDAPGYGPAATHVLDIDAAHGLLVADGPMGADRAVLVKGSRVAGLERLAERLLGDD
jgi:UDP-N-acetylmuramoyl-tripeptide--D-alanyl-D-alanine ligase